MGIEEHEEQPVSPTGQYFNSTALSVCVLAVLETGVPIDDSLTLTLLRDVFLPISPRFSSIMLVDKKGGKLWKKVQVELKNHVKVPNFPTGLSPNSYDECFNSYLSTIALEPLPPSQPLWEIHIVKYPTCNAAGNVVFKLHHALGDGFSLMGALLSCLQRVDDPSLPLTFPTLKLPAQGKTCYAETIKPRGFSYVFNSLSDFTWSLLKSCLIEDSVSPVRSGEMGAEFRPIIVSTMTFPLDWIKQIKDSLQVTINDVVAGAIFLGTRLYMEATNEKLAAANSTALVLLNTRIINGYKSVKEMVDSKSASPWGNQFAFLHVSLPELSSDKNKKKKKKIEGSAIEFVKKTQQIVMRKRNSFAVFLSAWFLGALRKFTGSEATAKYIHHTLRNSSMTISNLVGPLERMALANHPITGMYFMVVGVPQSLTITVISYERDIRIAVGTEKDFIDAEKFTACIRNAFDLIYKSSLEY